jgi:PAS domain S-box-containing protein
MIASYNQALNDLDIGVICLDKQLKISFLNQAFSKLTGYTVDEVLGRDWYFLSDINVDNATIASLQISIEQRQIHQSTLLNYRKDGSFFWNQLTFKPIEYQDQQYLITCRDVSEQMSQASELSSARQKSQAARDFLASMSHEIRTPLTGVLGLTELALHKTMPDEIRDYLQKIQLSSNNLLRIVNDILDFSKLEADKLSIEPHPVDLRQLVTEIHDRFSLNCQAKHLDLQLDLDANLPKLVFADQQRIQQILDNLVSNAIKFTETGKIGIALQLIKLDDQQALLNFSVTDSGIGISTTNLNKLLAPYAQADNTISRRFGGTGLGLSICQKLLKLMNSELKIESVINHGSRFSFEIELAANQETSNNRRRQKRIGGTVDLSLRNKGQVLRDKRILLAEDNAINQQVISEFLALCGIKAIITGNGEQAIQHFETQEFDVILMDINMPMMDGISATKHIRQFSKIPIIALSAGVTEHERQQCLAVGISDFASKPVQANELIDLLIKHCASESSNVNSIKPTRQAVCCNFENLLTLMGGNEAMLFGLLQEFQKDTALHVAEIQKAYQRQDYKKIQKHLHILLGSSGVIGAEKFYSVIAQYNSCLLRKQHDQQLHQAFLQAYQSISLELAELIKSAKEIQPISL